MENKNIINMDLNRVGVSYHDYENEDLDSLSLLRKEIASYPLLNDEETKLLFDKYSEGDLEARDQIFNSNLRLVYTIANNHKGKGVDIEDLFQEGTLGLLHAIDKFDISLDKKFSTYLYPWVEKYVRNAIINDGRTIRIPSHIHEACSKICKAKEKFCSENSYLPSSEELSEILGGKFTPEFIDEVDSIFYKTNCDSLDREIYEDTPVYEVVADTSEGEATYIDIEQAKLVRTMLDSLDERSSYVLDHLYGITSGKEESLEKVGKSLGLCKERVRQIKVEALGKIKEKFPNPCI